jgi:hypothetical protein
MKLKREILEAQDVRAAHELADILLKIHPEKNSDIVQEKAQERLLISLILASSEQGEACTKFFLDRLRDQDPEQWLDTFHGEAKTELESCLEIMTESYRKMLLQSLYTRIGDYALAHSHS